MKKLITLLLILLISYLIYISFFKNDEKEYNQLKKQAKKEFSLNNFDKSLHNIQEAIETDYFIKSHWVAKSKDYEFLAECYFHKGEFNNSIKAYSDALSVDYESSGNIKPLQFSGIYFNRGIAYCRDWDIKAIQNLLDLSFKDFDNGINIIDSWFYEFANTKAVSPQIITKELGVDALNDFSLCLLGKAMIFCLDGNYSKAHRMFYYSGFLNPDKYFWTFFEKFEKDSPTLASVRDKLKKENTFNLIIPSETFFNWCNTPR